MITGRLARKADRLDRGLQNNENDSKNTGCGFK